MNTLQETIVKPSIIVKNKSKSFGIDRRKRDSLFDRSKRVNIRDPTEISTIDRSVLPTYFATKTINDYLGSIKDRTSILDEQRMGLQYKTDSYGIAMIYDFGYNKKYKVTSTKCPVGFRYRTYAKGSKDKVDDFTDIAERTQVFTNTKEYPVIGRNHIFYTPNAKTYAYHIEALTNPQGFNPYAQNNPLLMYNNPVTMGNNINITTQDTSGSLENDTKEPTENN